MKLSRPSMSTATFARLLTARAQPASKAEPDGPRVRVMPSADGTVTIVGMTRTGIWIAEFRCRVKDFDERCVAAMDRRVRAAELEEEGRAIAIVR